MKIDKGAIDQSAGIVVNIDDMLEMSTFLGVTSYGQYYVSDGDPEDLFLTGDCYKTKSINILGKWNTLRIVFDGDYQRCFINNMLVDMVDINAFLEDDINFNGTIGFYLDKDVSEVTFDNLIIQSY